MGMEARRIWEECGEENWSKNILNHFLKACALGTMPTKDSAVMLWPLNVQVPLYFTSISWLLYTRMWSYPDFGVLYPTLGGVVFPQICPYWVPTCLLTYAPRLLGLGLSRKLSCGEKSWRWLLNIMRSSCERWRYLRFLGFSVGIWGTKRSSMRLRETWDVREQDIAASSLCKEGAYVRIQI